MTRERASSWVATIALDGGVDRPDVVFDGQLYERRVLARDLGASKDATDTDLVRAAYRRWGLDAPLHMGGVYTFVIWDADERKVVAGRDALGIYPLFYAFGANTLHLSPDLEALVGLPDVGGELNRAALADHIVGRWPDPQETYFAKVRRVPPGHVLTARRDSLDVRRYWFPVKPDEPARWVERDELDRFDALMHQAVERPLELGRPGVFLSGGLDSVSVAALAADITRSAGRDEPIALSLAFPEDAGEEEVQRGVAAQLGLPQIILPFEDAVGGSVLERALEVTASWPSPFTNAWHSAYRALTLGGKEEGVRVLVTGGGGDEWLTVTPLLAADLIRAGDVAGLYRLWQTMLRSFPVRPARTARNLLWSFGLKPIVADVGARRIPSVLRAYRGRQKRKLTPDWLAPDPELRRELDRRAYESSLPVASQGFYLREGQLSLDHALVSMEMEDFFETSRRTGVPIRMPFWDRDLVDFLYRARPEALMERGRSKGLVRQMLQRRFPHLGFERQKKVIATGYFSRLVATEAPELWRRNQGVSALSNIGIVDQRHLQSFTRAIFEGRGSPRDVARLWILMTLDRWTQSQLHGGGR